MWLFSLFCFWFNCALNTQQGGMYALQVLLLLFDFVYVYSAQYSGSTHSVQLHAPETPEAFWTMMDRLCEDLLCCGNFFTNKPLQGPCNNCAKQGKQLNIKKYLLSAFLSGYCENCFQIHLVLRLSSGWTNFPVVALFSLGETLYHIALFFGTIQGMVEPWGKFHKDNPNLRLVLKTSNLS